jgi:hypothetical protein
MNAWMGYSDIDLTVKRYGRFAAEALEHMVIMGPGLRVVK